MKLLYYTRTPLEESIYAPKLADSVHLALIEDGQCTPLLNNSGIVYAKAVPGDMGVLHAYSLRDPWMIRRDDLWLILAPGQMLLPPPQRFLSSMRPSIGRAFSSVSLLRPVYSAVLRNRSSASRRISRSLAASTLQTCLS